MILCLEGHCADIYEIRVHPHYPHVILSASKDKSVRIWNLKLACCVAILSGENGHREEVLSAVSGVIMQFNLTEWGFSLLGLGYVWKGDLFWNGPYCACLGVEP